MSRRGRSTCAYPPRAMHGMPHAATAASLAADSSMKPSWAQRPRSHPGQTRPPVRCQRRRHRDCHAASVATLRAFPNQLCEQRNFAGPAPRPRRCAGRAALRRWPLGSNRPRVCLPWATSWRWQPAPLQEQATLCESPCCVLLATATADVSRPRPRPHVWLEPCVSVHLLPQPLSLEASSTCRTAQTRSACSNTVLRTRSRS